MRIQGLNSIGALTFIYALKHRTLQSHQAHLDDRVARAACATHVVTSYSALNSTPRAMTARDITRVEVYSMAAPERKHVDVGLIQAERNNHLRAPTVDSFVTALRVRAAAMGCDAVIIGTGNGRVQ